MQTAEFVVLTHPSVCKNNNTGYSWGLLYVKSKNIIHLARPVQRGRIIALQEISGKMLDSFNLRSTRAARVEDEKMMDELKTWKISVNIPDDFFEAGAFERWAAEDICTWLRCDMSGLDGDETIYEIPDNLGEHCLEDLDIKV